VKTALLDYELPPVLIAQHPMRVRRHCRLLRLSRQDGSTAHHRFDELPQLLDRGDLLVVNDAAVIPARLLGQRAPGGGQAEVFLLEKLGRRRWRAMVRPGQRLRDGAVVEFPDRNGDAFAARVESVANDGTRVVTFHGHGQFDVWLKAVGHVPLPPYIDRPDQTRDRRDYQTVFARHPNSVAAPTAGLHFDKPLIARLRARGIALAAITLDVGAGTFRPIKSDRIEDHHMDEERFSISSRTLRVLAARKHTGRIIAVGTTVTRTLETLATHPQWRKLSERSDSPTQPGSVSVGSVEGRTDLFIRPGCRFALVDGLITNFHLPKSSLLALVAAFAGLDSVMAAYREAVEQQYRFYSYGDAMLIL